MRCKKCGSPYADISKTEDIGIGHARKTIYCAECKQTYTEDIQKNMPAGTIPIMIINKGYANFPLMVVSRNSQIGLSQWVDGDYTFCPLETCIFRYDG